MRAVAADHGGAGGERYVTGAVGGRVVGDVGLDARDRPGQRLQRLPDPVGLVPRGDDCDPAPSRSGGGGVAIVRFRLHWGLFCRPVPDILAHITGTVWKIEVAVGDEVDLDETVVILESMKMEMPVEAEDSGTVKEIRCEEGQSVAEGDVLVVLE